MGVPQWQLDNLRAAEEKEKLDALRTRISELEGVIQQRPICPDCRDQCLEKATKHFEAQLAAHRWIPVGEGLPGKVKDWTEYFIMTEEEGVKIDVYKEYANGHFWANYGHLTITHWKPITLPPAEQAGDSE